MFDNNDMSKETKYYNTFLFFSDFSRCLLEMFIPLILYKAGYSVREVILYLLVALIFSLGVSTFFGLIFQKFNSITLIGFANICLLILYILMCNIKLSFGYLALIAFIYSLFRRCLWIGKREYAIYTMSKEKNTVTGGFMTAISQFAGLLSGVIAGYILDKGNMIVLLILAAFLTILALAFLSRIKMQKEGRVTLKELNEVRKTFKFTDIVTMFCYEGIYLTGFLFPLYIFINVKEKCSFIGITNFVIGIFSMTFLILVSKYVDKSKKDLIRLVTLILSLILLIKLNMTSAFGILIISVFEGFFSKFQTVVYIRKLWCVDKEIKKSAYNLFLELVLGISRLCIVTLFYFLNLDLRTCIYVSICIFATMGVLGFKNDLKI